MFDLDELLKNKTVMMVLGVIAVVTIMNMFRAGRCRRRLRRVRENFAAAAAMGSGRRRRKPIERFAFCKGLPDFCKGNYKGSEVGDCFNSRGDPGKAADNFCKCGKATCDTASGGAAAGGAAGAAPVADVVDDASLIAKCNACKSDTMDRANYLFTKVNCETDAIRDNLLGSNKNMKKSALAEKSCLGVYSLYPGPDTFSNTVTTEGFGNTAPSRQVTTNTGKVYNIHFN